MRNLSALLLTLAAALPSALPAANFLDTVPPTQNTTSIPMPASTVPPAAFINGMNLKMDPDAQARARLKPRILRHRWAIGIDSVPGTGPAASGSVAVPNALSLRWWATDRLGVDLLAGGSYSSQQAGGSSLSTQVASSPGTSTYAGALALRYNLSEPSRDLLVQLLFKGSGAQAQAQPAGASGASGKPGDLSGFLGVGFEAFIPGWEWLSVEGSAGVTGYSQYTPQSAGSAASQTTSGLGLAGNGTSPFNFSVHVYF